MAASSTGVAGGGEGLLEKRKPSVDRVVLDNFTKLGNANESVRIKAARVLLDYLARRQDRYKPISTSEQSLCHALQYSVDRGVRGLASSRERVREGFFVLLVELLRRMPDIGLDHLKAALEAAETMSDGYNSKAERGDALVGKVMTFGAYIRARQELPTKEVKEISESLLAAAPKRIYVSTLSYNFLVELVIRVDKSTFKEAIWPSLGPNIVAGWDHQSLDKLWLHLVIRSRFPKWFRTHVCLPAFGSSDILEPEQFEGLGHVLLNVPVLSAALSHPSYQILTDQLDSSLLPFWESGMNSNLNSQTPARISLTLHLAELAVSKVENPRSLLTPTFLRLLKSSLMRNNESSLGAKSFVTKLVQVTSSEQITPDEQLETVTAFLKPPGSLTFDRYTRHTTVQQLTQVMQTEAVLKLADFYENMLLSSEAELRDRISSVSELTKLLSHRNMTNQTEWKKRVACVLLAQAFFRSESADLPSTGDLGHISNECLFKAMDVKFTRVSREDACDILWSLVQCAQKLMTGGEAVLLQEMEPDVKAEWAKMYKASARVHKKLKKAASLRDSWQDLTLLTLLLIVGLHLLTDPKMATEILQELYGCLDKLENEEIDDQSGDEPVWVEVVMELLLSLLSWNKHVLRSTACSLFSLLCPHLTSAALGQLLKVINPRESDDIVANIGDEEDDEDDDEQEANLNDDDEEEKESDDDSDGDDTDEEDGPIPVDNELRSKVQNALGDMMGTSDVESVDMDEMDDAAMERVDKALADIFCSIGGAKQERKGKKKTQSKQDTALMHFRTRVLDLLELFVQSQQPLRLLLQTIDPFLTALEFSVREKFQGPYRSRLQACFRKLAQTKKFTDADDLDGAQLEEMLKNVLERGKKMSVIMAEVGDALAQSCGLILRASVYLQNHEGIASVYASALSQFLYERDCVLPVSLFRQALQFIWDGAWTLGNVLAKTSFSAEVRLFRRLQAIPMLTLLVQNRPLLLSDKGKNVKQLEKEILEEATKFFVAAVETKDTPPKPKLLRHTYHMLFSLHNCLKWLEKDKTREPEQIPSWVALREALVDFRRNVAVKKDQDMKRTFNKLARALNISQEGRLQEVAEIGEEETAGAKKGKKKKKKGQGLVEEEEIMQEESEEGKKKKKKQKTKEQHAAKRKAKQSRMEAFSEGLGDATFSGLQEEECADYGSDEEEAEEETGKQVSQGETLHRKNKSQVEKRTLPVNGESSHKEEKAQKRPSNQSHGLGPKAKKKKMNDRMWLNEEEAEAQARVNKQRQNAKTKKKYKKKGKTQGAM